MKTYQRLLVLATLVVAEIICAQPAPNTDGTGPGRGGPHRSGPGGPGRFHPVLRALDADQDREISATEIANAAAALLTLDANRDGVVATAELRPPFPGRRPPPPAAGSDVSPRLQGRPHPVDPVMLALDANGDGELSAGEIAGAPASLKALDANGDGKLTRDELRPLPPVK